MISEEMKEAGASLGEQFGTKLKQEDPELAADILKILPRIVKFTFGFLAEKLPASQLLPTLVAFLGGLKGVRPETIQYEDESDVQSQILRALSGFFGDKDSLH